MTTDNKESKSFSDIMEALISEGSNGFLPIIEWLWNQALKVERQQHLNAKPYERSAQRCGYANGFKDRTLHSRLGDIHLQIPQVRGQKYKPASLESHSRSEQALKLAIAEMYVQGVSTRRVEQITETLCGLNISSTQVSNISKQLDSKLEEFRQRPLGEFPFIILNARYEKVRHTGSVQDLAVLIAIGINKKGQREVLGVSVSLSEAEVHWRTFIESLSTRGLKGGRLIVSDDHSGLKAARKAVYPSVAWQRCQFHMAQNAQSYAPKKSMRNEVADALRDIFQSRNIDEARERVKETIETYKDKAPDFSQWLDDNIEEGLVILKFPKSIRRRLRTSNMLEVLNKQIKRRTRVAGVFPNKESCSKLITAILQEQHEDWLASRAYLNLDDFD